MGTLDLVAKLADGQTWLLDWKTGGKGIFREAALQLCAYRNADFYVDGNGDEQPCPRSTGPAACGFAPTAMTSSPLTPARLRSASSGTSTRWRCSWMTALATGERFILEALEQPARYCGMTLRGKARRGAWG